MAKSKKKLQKEQDEHQANVVISVASVIGLTVCTVAYLFYQKDVPLILFAIFGGGILGADNVIKIIKSVFRVGK